MIKLIEKKGRDKRYIQNWRPISLLNVDAKLISKALVERLRNVLPDIVSSNQTAYVENRFISESGRLIDDVLEICDTFNKKGFLVTIDIEKAFDSVNHLFIIEVLRRFGFREWVKILLNKQESCILNGGKTNSYFELERGTRQADPISAYLFILVLEIVFLCIKNDKKVKGIDYCQQTFLYTAYADDTTFFLADQISVFNLMKIYIGFSSYSGLKPNKKNVKLPELVSAKGPRWHFVVWNL